MSALEALARDVAGLPNATLGEIASRRPDLFPKPLDKAMAKLWGYASNEARHALEGRAPRRKEVELVVHVAAALIVYVSNR